jgi:Ca2+-binding RTX toxin-like protein
MNFTQAIAELNVINGLPNLGDRLQRLRQLVYEVNASAGPGQTGLLYSGELRPAGAGLKIHTQEIAQELARIRPDIAIVDNTDVGRLLLDQRFESAVLAANGGNEALTKLMMGGVQSPAHSPDSFWGIASKHFVASLSGPVAALVGEANPWRTFSQIEVTAALLNPNITHLAGVPIADLLAVLSDSERLALSGSATSSVENAFLVAKGAALNSSLGVSAQIGLRYDLDGTPLVGGDGVQERGVYTRFSADWAKSNAINTGGGNVDFADSSRGRFGDADIRNTTFQRIVQMLGESDTILKARALLGAIGKELPVVGLGLTAWMVAESSAQAAEMYRAGDKRGAQIKLASTAGNITGSELGGLAAAVAFSPLLAAGPVGWVAYGGVVVTSSLVGGRLGEIIGAASAGAQIELRAPGPQAPTQASVLDLSTIQIYDKGPDFGNVALPSGYRVDAAAGEVIELSTGLKATVVWKGRQNTATGQWEVVAGSDGKFRPLMIVSAHSGSIVKITVSSSKGSGTLIIEAQSAADLSEIMRDVSSAISSGNVAGIDQLPQELAKKPKVRDVALVPAEMADALIQRKQESLVQITELSKLPEIANAPGLKTELPALMSEWSSFAAGMNYLSNVAGVAFRIDLTSFSGVFGSVLGQNLARSSPYASVVVSAALSSSLSNLAASIKRSQPASSNTSAQTPSGAAPSSLMDKISGDFLTNLKGQATGAISSYLASELASAVGLRGGAAQFASSVGAGAISQIVSNLTGSQVWATVQNNVTTVLRNGTGQAISVDMSAAPPQQGAVKVDRPWNLDLKVSVASAAASFIGGRLADAIHKFETVGGQIGAAMGQTYAAMNSAAMMIQYGVNPLTFAVAVIAIAVWRLIGGFIGSLFGGKPRSGADLIWSDAEGKFVAANVWSKNRGSADAARSMADSAAGLVNQVISVSRAQLLSPRETNVGAFGTNGRDFTYRPLGLGGGVVAKSSRDIGEIVAHGQYALLSSVVNRLAGGDVWIKRALLGVVTQVEASGGSGAFDPNALAGGIIAAQDYARYLQNRDKVAALIAADPQSAVSLGWVATLSLASELGLDRRQATDWIGGWNVFLDESADRVLNGVALPASSMFALHYGEHNARLFVFQAADGSILGLTGDTIESDRKSKIFGTAAADLIVVERATWTSTRSITEDVIVDQGVFRHPLSGVYISVNQTFAGAPVNIASGVTLVAANRVSVTYDVNTATNGWRVQNAANLSFNGTLLSSGPSPEIRVAAFIDGGAGADTIVGGDLGNDLLGGDGDDLLVGGALDDWLFGGAGSDRLFAGGIDYTITDVTALEALSVSMDSGNGDLLDGGEGDDLLVGGRGSDWLKGGAGVDRLIGGAGGDILEGGAGDDRGANGEARLLGGAGSDQYVFGYGDGQDVVFDEQGGGAGKFGRPACGGRALARAASSRALRASRPCGRRSLTRAAARLGADWIGRGEAARAA